MRHHNVTGQPQFWQAVCNFMLHEVGQSRSAELPLTVMVMALIDGFTCDISVQRSLGSLCCCMHQDASNKVLYAS